MRRSPFSGTSTPELRILTWNLFHGRSVPAAGRDLSAQFAALLAGWSWDVALLQEVPPWWPPRLARAARAEQRTVLTSRNSGLWMRRFLAERRPDLIKSNGGGCNAILARRAIVEHHTLHLRLWPERRVAQLARLSDGTCVVNYHASARVKLAEAELQRLWDQALQWAAEDPLILGGDLNLRNPTAPRDDTVHFARRDVDHLFARGLRTSGGAELLDRHLTLAGGQVELSDHVPLLGTVRGEPSIA
ncbi:MAG: endonuclease/exonuclease/phosphatase family protein [Actinobacteria bacterium]|nr:MAG: endonuclease/exonuclease/phosphatase family protein [Actinomycetota bacterium]